MKRFSFCKNICFLVSLFISIDVVFLSSVAVAAEMISADVPEQAHLSFRSGGQDVAGLGKLIFENSMLQIRYLEGLKLQSEPKFSAYALAAGNAIVDIQFPGVRAVEGGSVVLNDSQFEKIIVGKSKQGDILIRLYGRPEIKNLESKLKWRAYSEGFELSSLLPSVSPVVTRFRGEVPVVAEDESVDDVSEDGDESVSDSEEVRSNVSVKEAPAAVVAPQSELQSSQREEKSDVPVLSSAGVDLSAGDGLWQRATIVLVGLSLMGFAAYTLLRLKHGQRWGLGFSRNAHRHMELISSLGIGPKRQVLLLKIRDQEIAIASTEHGVQFLAEVQRPGLRIADIPVNQSLSSGTMSPSNSHSPIINNSEDKKSLVSAALKQMVARKGTVAADNKNSEKTDAKSNKSPQFSKYFANAFEKEKQRNTKEDLTEYNKKSSSEQDVESVANLIRQKIKQMNTTA